MSKISIIVPVYNVEKYLENCIESILNQTFKDYELILVNDGSTDKSGEICDDYKKKDSRIRVIHKANGGLSSARNEGLNVACGQYIGFVDSDDSIHPRMYEILYDLIQKYKADISYCNYKNTYDLINKQHEEIKFMEVSEMNNIQAINSLYEDYIGVKLVVAWNKLYNKDLFNDLRYKVGRIHEDEFMAHRILYKCNKIVYVNTEMYYYLQREGSIMSKLSDKRRVDKLLSQSDRMRFFKKIDLINICDDICKMYLYEFLKLYKELINKGEYDKKFLYELRRDFILNLRILFKQNYISIKEKISYLIFAISPRIYIDNFLKNH